MSTNLTEAFHQWATRPEDQRFESLKFLHAFCAESRAKSIETKPAPYRTLRAEAQNGDIFLLGEKKIPAKLSHYSFGQVSRMVGAPAEYLRTLPATLATQALNHGLKVKGEDAKNDARLLLTQNGQDFAVRSINGEMYDRVWNADLTQRMFSMEKAGWRTPPARPAFQNQTGTRKATADDILPNQGDFGLSIRVGDDIAPAGMYASDHDLFVFMVNVDRAVRAGNRYLMRGVFFRNSEVGDGSLVAKFFLLDNVCGNHICWGVQNVHEIRLTHRTGKNRHGQNDTLNRMLQKFSVELRQYEQAGAEATELQIQAAQKFELGATKDEVLDAVFKYARSHSLPALTQTRLADAYDLAVMHEDWYGNPNTVWGMVSGLTESSQQSGWQDVRSEVDQQAAKLMQMAF